MKTNQILLPFFLLPSTVLAGARLLGPLVDTIPPLPPPPITLREIPADGIVQTKVHDLGDRKLILQKVTAAVLPALANPPPPQPPRGPLSAEAKERMMIAWQAQLEMERKTPRMIAVVYHSQAMGEQVRTIFTLQVPPQTLLNPDAVDFFREFTFFEGISETIPGRTIQFWSSIDANYLNLLPRFEGADGTVYEGLRISVGNIDLDERAVVYAARGRTYQPPFIPAISAGSHLITKGNPEQEDTAVIEAIHDLYFAEYEGLKVAFESREREKTAQQDYLKAHPVAPQDIVLRYRLIDENETRQQPAPTSP